jgi:glycosyltransferase involved in cell wall biosynthesis
MRVSVIVSTYNEPDRLAFVLAALGRQTRLPDEVLVADDGSGPESASVVRHWQAKLGFRCEHVWHEDSGFRKWAISNEAVRRSSGDWLIFIDGDSIPHREYVRDHLLDSTRGDVLCGRRVKLGPTLTNRVTLAMVESGELESIFGPALLGGLFSSNQRMALGLRLPRWLAHAMHPFPRKLMGVNFSLSRRAFEAVNGWDEEWPGRRGDRDLDLRLNRGGFRYAALMQRGIVYHLYHLERPNSEAIQRRVAMEEQATRVRCENGLVRSAAPTSSAILP